jgi:hypothetical protein
MDDTDGVGGGQAVHQAQAHAGSLAQGKRSPISEDVGE